MVSRRTSSLRWLFFVTFAGLIMYCIPFLFRLDDVCRLLNYDAPTFALKLSVVNRCEVAKLPQQSLQLSVWNAVFITTENTKVDCGSSQAYRQVRTRFAPS